MCIILQSKTNQQTDKHKQNKETVKAHLGKEFIILNYKPVILQSVVWKTQEIRLFMVSEV